MSNQIWLDFFPQNTDNELVDIHDGGRTKKLSIHCPIMSVMVDIHDGDSTRQLNTHWIFIYAEY